MWSRKSFRFSHTRAKYNIADSWPFSRYCVRDKINMSVDILVIHSIWHPVVRSTDIFGFSNIAEMCFITFSYLETFVIIELIWSKIVCIFKIWLFFSWKLMLCAIWNFQYGSSNVLYSYTNFWYYFHTTNRVCDILIKSCSKHLTIFALCNFPVTKIPINNTSISDLEWAD